MEHTLLNQNHNYNQMNPAEILFLLQDRRVLVVDPNRRNGLIIYKRYHAEFAGPGAIVGEMFDADVLHIIPVGNLSFINAETLEEKRSAYSIRREWIRLIKQITDNPLPIERAKIILKQFKHWFDTETISKVPDEAFSETETISKIPDEAFSKLVGVFPQTIRRVRNGFDFIDVF